ncbi:MAG: S-adenosylmethionine:tRNA ribosyltransferase-isomerase [Bacteroidia bacterium]|nr:S-adenosylmethionine:tRNA ribosyltransferase-isomerase [Bacteroidia bacterium]
MKTLVNNIIQFDLPDSLACPLPTERRNIKRDEVRLLVSKDSGELLHDHFHQLDHYLSPGDVLVVNTSATIPAALPLKLSGGIPAKLHLSTRLSERKWLVEIREIQGDKSIRWKEGEQGMIFDLPAGGRIQLQERHYREEHLLDLWKAEIHLDQELETYLAKHGRPIKYTQLNESYPLSYYQTQFSFHPGSVEMPSAGRAFSLELMKRLIRKGIVFAPILLHCGVSSLEEGEKPYSEYMEVNPLSALRINEAKRMGKRIIAVGTTAIRAIESAVNEAGIIEPYRGKTDLYIHESYPIKVTDGLLSGFHEPKASHLHILQALLGFKHIERAYKEAIRSAYHWHQFGDLHLMLK